MKVMNYSDAIRGGFDYLLSHHPEIFVLGQGVGAHGTLVELWKV